MELKAKRLLPIPVPRPPLSEQRRIVMRMEELSVQLQEARILRHQATKEADALVGSSLHHLSKDIVIDGILNDVLGSSPRNGWSANCDNADYGTPVLSLSAVTGFQYRASEFKRTSMHAATDGHFWLKPGDLLITRSNTPELVGHVAIYNGTPSPCIYPDLMMRLDTPQIHHLILHRPDFPFFNAVCLGWLQYFPSKEVLWSNFYMNALLQQFPMGKVGKLRPFRENML